MVLFFLAYGVASAAASSRSLLSPRGDRVAPPRGYLSSDWELGSKQLLNPSSIGHGVAGSSWQTSLGVMFLRHDPAEDAADKEVTYPTTVEDAAPGLMLSVLAGAATALGALFLFCLPEDGPPPEAMAFALSLAAGVMVAVSIPMVMPHGGEITGENFWRTLWLFLGSAFFFAAICRLADVIEQQTHGGKERDPPLVAAVTAGDEETPEAEEERHQRRSMRLAVLLLVSLTLHNIPEGFAVAVSAISNKRLGITVGIAVALHNIPEGVSLAVATHQATKSRWKATLVPAFAGCAEPLGALLSLFVLRAFVTHQLVHDLLVLVAGVMCYLAFGELLPEALRTHCWWSVAGGFFAGVCVMVLTHEILEHAGIEGEH